MIKVRIQNWREFENQFIDITKKIQMSELPESGLNPFIIYRFTDRRPDYIYKPNNHVYFGYVNDLGLLVAEDEITHF